MVRKIKIAFIILIVILTVSCKNNNQSKNDVIGSRSPLPFVTSSAIDDYSFNLENNSQKKKDSNMNQELVKEFWINNRIALENVADDMMLLGIDYIAEGKGFILEDENIREIDINSVGSVKELLEQSDDLIDQIGWSLPGDPLFPDGEKYFYCETPVYKIDGKEISYTLVFSKDSIGRINPYTVFEELMPNWIIVTNYYGE